MKALADVNVLFALLIAGHPHHGTAWRWWQECGDGTVALCWPTRLGVLRLLTNGTAMHGHPVAPETALVAWESLALDPRTFWLDPAATHERFFRKFVNGREPSPNLWNDAWLAALAASESCRLTSFDADFKSFELPKFEHLKPDRGQSMVL